MRNQQRRKGITLIALVITIIILLILAGVSISIIIGRDNIIERTDEASETTKMEMAREKLNIMLGEYGIKKYTNEILLINFFNEKLLSGEIQSIVEDNDIEKYIIVEVDGYEFTIDKGTLTITGAAEKAEGLKPIVGIQVTKIDGTNLEGEETQKALTIDIKNREEYGENYTIEVKNQYGKVLTKETKVVGNLTGQASYKITEKGIYTIIVTGIKDGKTRTTLKVEEITLEMIKVTTQFEKKYGVIDIVWLDMKNNVIEKPISPESYLSGLKPVKYDGNKWVEVDSKNTNKEWYDYVEQEGDTNQGGTSNWANAVSSDGNAYFVWIPRYAYRITYFNTAENAEAYRKDKTSKTGIIGYSTIDGMIEVSTETLNLVEGTQPTNVKGKVKTLNYAEYIPHPAFEFEGEKAGIWVGKFESSGSANKITILPNKSSLRNMIVGNMFVSCQGVKITYNLTGDSHLMKNTEWGAVAYLTDSKFGRNGTNVSINTKDITGGVNYKSNVLQSTTGNIYGIYDMSGTYWEYVAGYINSNNISSNTSLTKLLEAVKQNSKYADVYIGTEENTKEHNYINNRGVKGDATYETSTSCERGKYSWHNNFSQYITNNVVFYRGRSILFRY